VAIARIVFRAIRQVEDYCAAPEGDERAFDWQVIRSLRPSK
jgi:hypothetical protein